MEENKTQTDDYADYHGSVENMNEVDECLDLLIAAIWESEEYRHYQEIRRKIKLEPEKEQAIHSFRMHNFMLQENKENMDLFEEIDKLEQEFSLFRQEPLVEDYLSAELAVCRLVQRVNRKLMSNVDFDIGFFGSRFD